MDNLFQTTLNRLLEPESSKTKSQLTPHRKKILPNTFAEPHIHTSVIETIIIIPFMRYQFKLTRIIASKNSKKVDCQLSTVNF